MNLLKELLQIIAEDTFHDKVKAWKDSVFKAYPQVSSRIKFKTKDQGKFISAEIDGEDCCYGVFDLEKETGEVLEEETCKPINNKKFGEKLFKVTSKRHKVYVKVYAKDHDEAYKRASYGDSSSAFRNKNDNSIEELDEK
jgi:hypothetical protein